MSVRKWIRDSERQGWRLAKVTSRELHMRCACTGCPGARVLPIENLGPTLGPCDLPHIGPYSAKAFDSYTDLVEELRRRRRELGLDQGDVTEAAGMTDGYIAKLESHSRIPTIPTLILWAQTLGLHLTTSPAPLPSSTRAAIDERRAEPYQHQKATFKHAR